MPKAKAKSPPGLGNLIAQFDRNAETYQGPAFNETATRIQLLNPLFELLGWDVNNKSGNAEQYKDVVHEDVLKIGGNTKAPDYSFRVGAPESFSSRRSVLQPR